MHEHMTLQDFILSVFSIGTPFLICCYCCFKCTDKYCEIDNREDFDDDDEIQEYNENESEINMESNLSPRTIRVINKYGHFKPDYSTDSELYSESDYTSESNYTSDSNYTSESDSEHDNSSENDEETVNVRDVENI